MANKSEESIVPLRSEVMNVRGNPFKFQGRANIININVSGVEASILQN